MFKPHPYQQKILDAVLKSKGPTILMMPRSAGKSHLLKMINEAKKRIK